MKGQDTMSKHEREPQSYAFSLEIGDKMFICTSENTFGYLYENSDYDYVFIKTSEDENAMYGFRVYRHLMDDLFDDMVKKMIKNGFTVYSEDEPDEEDLQAYHNSLPKEFTVPYPDTEWGNTKNEQAQKWGAFVAYLAERIANGDEL